MYNWVYKEKTKNTRRKKAKLYVRAGDDLIKNIDVSSELRKNLANDAITRKGSYFTKNSKEKKNFQNVRVKVFWGNTNYSLWQEGFTREEI